MALEREGLDLIFPYGTPVDWLKQVFFFYPHHLWITVWIESAEAYGSSVCDMAALTV